MKMPKFKITLRATVVEQYLGEMTARDLATVEDRLDQQIGALDTEATHPGRGWSRVLRKITGITPEIGQQPDD